LIAPGGASLTGVTSVLAGYQVGASVTVSYTQGPDGTLTPVQIAGLTPSPS
jgi:hypothetical protein